MDYRLPRSVLPVNYEITIAPDFETATFSGTVIATTEVVETTSQLRCNALDLELSDVLVDGVAAEFLLDTTNEQLVVDLGTVREPGPLTLHASFTGVLNDDLRGFYRSTFVDEAGVEQTIATTQFQSTDARRAFPCWDEPEMKATFDVTLVVDEHLTAVSNGGELERTPQGDGKVAVRFAQTMKMSTYLVAFVVGPLDVTEPAMAGDTPVRIVHRPGQGELTSFALEVAVHALAYFEDYYGIPYPADKLDMIALPDFAMGAMENLGCVTYREILLLVDPETATQPELQNVADVINHELAHMWFGDLVTMRWWNGIWLNEAFATFMEMKATDAFRPDWQRWTSFGISRSAAFDVDSLEATRPIEFPVVSPADAEAMFDLLTYEKGAAVVRMLEQWLGEETFRDGIRYYLSKHAYENTDTNDLWDALEHVAGQPVTESMETWIFQGGYPVISSTGEAVSQRRFTYVGAPSDALWSVPVQIRMEDDVVHTVELHGASTQVELDLDRVATFNHRSSGFYRVQLDSSTLARLGESGVGHLDASERVSIFDDTWSLALAGTTPVSDLLTLIDGYRDEDDISVWQKILAALSFIDHVADDGDRRALHEYIADVIAPARARLGLSGEPGESMRIAQLRGALFSAAGTRTPIDGEVRTETIAHARSILTTAEADPEMFAAAVRVIAANGTDDDFASFRAGFESADNPQAEIRYLYSLPSFPGANHIDQLTTMALDGSIRSQNAPFVLAQALMNRSHGPAVWERIQASWEAINDAFPSNTIVRMLTGTRWLTSDEAAASVHSFFEARPIPQGQKQLDQHLERLTVNTAFRVRMGSDLAGALDR